MVIFSILFLLLSNAVTLRRDKSILFSRIVITVLLYSSLIAFYSLYFCLDSAVGLYGGLFHVTTTTHVFHIFIFLISICLICRDYWGGQLMWVKVVSFETPQKVAFYRLRGKKKNEKFRVFGYV